MTDDSLALAYQKLRDIRATPISSGPFWVDLHAPTWAKRLKVKAASFQGLPNELQFKILRMAFSWTQDHPNDFAAGQAWDFSSIDIQKYYLRCLRRSIIGLARILPHFRFFFLGWLRVERMTRVWHIKQADWDTVPGQEKRFLMYELWVLEMMIAYLETGDISKLQKPDFRERERLREWDSWPIRGHYPEHVRRIRSALKPLEASLFLLWLKRFRGGSCAKVELQMEEGECRRESQ